MTDIPDQAVVGGIEDVMQRHRDLGSPETRSEMATGCTDRVYQLVAQFSRDLFESRELQAAQTVR
jgi:hypothetical protein